MLLRHHQALGVLPETIVLAFLGGTVVALGYTTALVMRRTPVLLVAEAAGCGMIAPARADDAYLLSFASDFLQHWESWNRYTCTYRQAHAIAMLASPARAGALAAATRADGLRLSLQQSQDLELSRLEVVERDGAHGLVDVRFVGAITTYFGGVGGGADACQGHLYLHAITPSAANPLCLEVVGFALSLPAEHP